MLLDIFRAFAVIDRTIGLHGVDECGSIFGNVNRRNFWIPILDRFQGIGETGRPNFPTHCRLCDLLGWWDLLKSKRCVGVADDALREIEVNANEVDWMLNQLEISRSDVRGDQRLH